MISALWFALGEGCPRRCDVRSSFSYCTIECRTERIAEQKKDEWTFAQHDVASNDDSSEAIAITVSELVWGIKRAHALYAQEVISLDSKGLSHENLSHLTSSHVYT